MNKNIIPFLVNPQGPWAQEAANEAWSHPKRHKALADPTPTVQGTTAKHLAQSGSAQAADPINEEPKTKTRRRRCTDVPKTGEQVEDVLEKASSLATPIGSKVGILTEDPLYGTGYPSDITQLLFNELMVETAVDFAALGTIGDTAPTANSGGTDTLFTSGYSMVEERIPGGGSDGETVEWTITGATIEMTIPGSDSKTVIDIGEKEVRRDLLEAALRWGSSSPSDQDHSTLTEVIYRLSHEKLNQLKQILRLEFDGYQLPGFDDAVIIKLATSVFKDASSRTGEVDGAKQVLSRVGDLRSSISELLQRQKVLDARRRLFVTVAYDGLLQASRNIIASIDERLRNTKPVQAARKEDDAWGRAILDVTAALIESGVADVIWQQQSDLKAVDENDIEKTQTLPAVGKEKKAGKRRRRKYVVQLNDTLESIARKKLGNSVLAPLIFQINESVISLQLAGHRGVPDLSRGLILQLPSDSEVMQFNRLVHGKNANGNFETI